jgi:TonB family protein
MRVLPLALLLAMVGACVDSEQSKKMAQAFQAPPRPDEAPRMLNKEPPFTYPPALYAQKIQGNVTLRLFLDRDGRVNAESTQVVESSGYASFDSAAIRGSQELRFVPAKTRGEPQAITILFPV